MHRDRSQFLKQWLASEGRKPLVIRGARQVGKTWLIRDLAKQEDKQLVELNFEKRPDYQSLFNSNSPDEIMSNISSLLGRKISLKDSLLFLDEIQAAPQLLSKLRWFAEDMPELAVIAAGSLLDFALSDHVFSMPVGRIGYMYLEPLSFEEFLEAIGKKSLKEYLTHYSLASDLPDAIHNQLYQHTKEYLLVGGMPDAVMSWSLLRDFGAVNQIHFNLLSTYRDDFSKYSGKLTLQRLEDILSSTPRQLGHKFIYTEANPDSGISGLKQALELLTKARVCHRVEFSSANGLPLSAESNDKFFKLILLDTGLCGAALGLNLHQIASISDLSVINSGAMAEQLAGQILRTLVPAYVPPALYYWQQTKKNAEAEIDYIVQHESKIIPLEVKAGKTGSLKSLHYFMGEKNKDLAIRVNSDKPSVCIVNTPSGHSYTLISIPFYLLGQVHRLINSL